MTRKEKDEYVHSFGAGDGRRSREADWLMWF